MGDSPKRRSKRLHDYDYSQSGAYFITICTQDKAMLFGKVTVGADLVSARMNLNDAGNMVERVYNEIIALFPNVISGSYVVMPNHFHCVIGISYADRADTRSAPTVAIPGIIQAFKSKTTVEYIRGVKSGIYPPFVKRVWQRNYYEHVIRNEAEYISILQYIDANPTKWMDDCYYMKG